MFPKNEAAKSMKDEGMVGEFEARSRLFEEARRIDPARVGEFLGHISGSGLEKRLGKRALGQLKAASKRDDNFGGPALPLELFVSVEDGQMEVLLPAKYAKKYHGLQASLLEYAKACMGSVGSVHVAEYRGLANLIVKITNPGKLHRALDALDAPPEGFSDAGIEYSLHIHQSAHVKPAKKHVVKNNRGENNPNRIKLYEYLSNHSTITIKTFSDVAGIGMDDAAAMLSYDAKMRKLKRVDKGVYTSAKSKSETRISRPRRDSTRENLGRGVLKEKVRSYLTDHATIDPDTALKLGFSSIESAKESLRHYDFLELASKGVYALRKSESQGKTPEKPPVAPAANDTPVAPAIVVKTPAPYRPEDDRVATKQPANDYDPNMTDVVDRLYILMLYFNDKGGRRYEASRRELYDMGYSREELKKLKDEGYIDYQGLPAPITVTKQGLRWLSDHRPGAVA